MKKIIIMTLAVFMLATSAFAYNNSFSDVDNHWSKTWVEKLVEKNITSGYPDGTFKPEGTVTVNEFITFTVRALQTFDNDKYKVTTNSTDWAKPFRDVAIANELIYDGQFLNFDRAITREEMSSIIIKANGKQFPMNQVHNETINAIHDYYLISDQYKNDMLLAVAEGFITGKDKIQEKIVIDPKGTAKRSETAVLIVKLLNKDLRTPLVLDIPSTTFKSTLYDGAIKTKIDSTYYAAKNTEGEYVTEIFDFLHHFQKFDFNRIDGNYSYYSGLITVDFKALDKYKENYYGSFWSFERNDIIFEYNSKQFSYGASPYSLLINSSPWHTVDYENTVEYIKGEYGEHIEWMFEYFFEEDKTIALSTFYHDLENKVIGKVYNWNGRTVKISGSYGGISMWFDEKVD